MQPTLFDGDRLLVLRGAGLGVGDIAVVRLPGPPSLAVKRVVHREPRGWWVERDNAREGADSWAFGAVADADVEGRVLARVWPLWRRRVR
jgi:SOS-response transcriptional repressor LexA